MAALSSTTKTDFAIERKSGTVPLEKTSRDVVASFQMQELRLAFSALD
jgi:hypothetical protein